MYKLLFQCAAISTKESIWWHWHNWFSFFPSARYCFFPSFRTYAWRALLGKQFIGRTFLSEWWWEPSISCENMIDSVLTQLVFMTHKFASNVHDTWRSTSMNQPHSSSGASKFHELQLNSTDFVTILIWKKSINGSVYCASVLHTEQADHQK